MVVTKKEYLLNIWVGDPKDRRRYPMSDFKRLAHAIWQCKYHIVWCPKYRFRILKGAVQKSVMEIITQLCEWKKLEILEMNILEDHVHLVISVPPKFAVSDTIGFLNKHLELKKRYWGRHFWAKGYCVSIIIYVVAVQIGFAVRIPLKGNIQSKSLG
jgi:putative transposase